MQAIDANMEQLKASENQSSDVGNEQEAVLDALGQIASGPEHELKCFFGFVSGVQVSVTFLN